MTAKLPIEDVLPGAERQARRPPRRRAGSPARRRQDDTGALWRSENEPWVAGKKILMLEPRRIAARAAAARMAEPASARSVGETVGYRVRLDAPRRPQNPNRSPDRRPPHPPPAKRPGTEGRGPRHLRRIPRTQPRRRLRARPRARNPSGPQRRPENPGDVGHARRRPRRETARRRADDPQRRPPPSRSTTRYTPPAANARIEQAMASAILRALDETEGGILVFLPGEAEIRSVETLLKDEEHGATLTALRRALRRSPRPRHPPLSPARARSSSRPRSPKPASPSKTSAS